MSGGPPPRTTGRNWHCLLQCFGSASPAFVKVGMGMGLLLASDDAHQGSTGCVVVCHSLSAVIPSSSSSSGNGDLSPALAVKVLLQHVVLSSAEVRRYIWRLA